MQFIKVTKKGNVKVNDAGQQRKAYFHPLPEQLGCDKCVLTDAGFCHRSPCADSERELYGQPRVDGNFQWDKP